MILLRNKKPLILAKIIYDKVFKTKLSNFNDLKFLFEDKEGIEIGGPSPFFSKNGFVPLYGLAKGIDGCNFSSNTVWEGEIKEGNTYQYGDEKTGHQFICEGADVEIIPKNHYDFVLSCNNLEHIANPLKAVSNWLNLLKNDGAIVLVLPRKESNFDHKRPVTKFQHLLEDYNAKIGEDDLTHLPDILELHDIELDPPLNGSKENLKNRGQDNLNNRCLHHHVFDLALLEEICNFFHLEVVAKESKTTDHVIIARKKMSVN